MRGLIITIRIATINVLNMYIIIQSMNNTPQTSCLLGSLLHHRNELRKNLEKLSNIIYKLIFISSLFFNYNHSENSQAKQVTTLTIYFGGLKLSMFSGWFKSYHMPMKHDFLWA